MIRLESYHISLRTGFLLYQPLRQLPSEFSHWNDLAKEAAELVGRKSLRERVDQMPLLDHRSLKSYREKRLAHLQLTVISSCYIWQEGDAGVPKVLPECLSVPWWGVSRDLGLQPSVNHAALVLANWTIDEISDRSMSLDALDWLYPWPGGDSAKWFVLVTVQMERDFVPALIHMESGLNSIRTGDEQSLVDCLLGVQQTIEVLKSTFSQIHDRVDPADFYDKLRPFLSGWGGAGSPLPEGLVYTGVSDKPQQFVGGSAAQSSIFPTIDAFLGVKHTNDEKIFLLTMRQYMPPGHRRFIEAIEGGPSLRQYVMETRNKELKGAYRSCLNTLISFRTYHMSVVAKYIVQMSHRKDRDEVYESVSKQGTGGSSLIPFLKAVRSTTEDASI